MRSESCVMQCKISKSTLAVIALLTGLLTLVSCASVPAPPPAEETGTVAYVEGVPGGVIVNTLSVTARVKAIDKVNRKVILVDASVKAFPVKVGPEAVNFDQIRAGDLVNFTVTEELVIYMNGEGGSSGDGSAGLVALAPEGARPGGLFAETRQITGTVTAIDPEKHTATLKFEDGTVKTFPVRSDVDLSKGKIGEQVVFLITEMIAIRVETP